MPMRVRALAFALSLVTAIGGAILFAAPAQAAQAGNAASVFSLTNAQRTKAGLKPLMTDAALDEAAQVWAQHLASTCAFEHSSSSWRSGRTSSSGWAATGENIAAGYATPSAVMAGWMGSSGHKANILNKSYTGLGVGYATSSCTYKTYWVQTFGLSKVARQAGAGDVNGDFDADVLAQNASGQLLAYRGSGSGGWDGTTVASSGWAADDALVTLGDFTGDGIPDVGRIRSDGTFELLNGTGAGTYATTATSIGFGWGIFDAVIGGLDFNGDGKTDVIGRTSAGTLMLYRGNGAGGWTGGSTVIGKGWSSMNVITNAGDFNGDGKTDVIARRTNGTLWLYPTTGTGSWGTPRQIGSGWGSFTAVFSPGDFDGSGKPDVLVRRSDGSLVLYRGNGKGGWGATSVVGSGWGGMVQLG
jgi:hypothetical protein